MRTIAQIIRNSTAVGAGCPCHPICTTAPIKKAYCQRIEKEESRRGSHRHIGKKSFTIAKCARLKTNREFIMSSTQTEKELALMEERLLAQQTISAFLIAHLAIEDVIKPESMRKNIDMIAISSGFGKDALSDINRVFGLAERMVEAFGKHSE
ncbi:MAG: hypothetical protein ACXV7J_16020 [Methylomonas sp.]